MKETKVLLVGLDLTESDPLLLRYASMLGKSLGTIRQVYFVHNIKLAYESEAPGFLPELDRPLEEIITEEIEEQVDQFFKRSHPDMPFEVIVTNETNTPTALSQLCKEQEVDLVLMGKKIAYIGSGIVVQKLLRVPTLTANVLLVPDTASQHLQHIVAGIDFSEPSRRALLQASSLQQASGAELTLLHVAHIPTHYFPYIPEKDMKEKARESARKKYEKFIKRMEDPELRQKECRIVQKHGESIARNIYSEALQLGADLIVTGSIGHGKVKTFLLGSVTQRLVNIDSHIPLLVVKGKDK